MRCFFGMQIAVVLLLMVRSRVPASERARIHTPTRAIDMRFQLEESEKRSIQLQFFYKKLVIQFSLFCWLFSL